MGYCVRMKLDVVIPKNKVEDCLKAINKLQTEEYANIKDAFEAWRYITSTDSRENVTITFFDGEKWGNDEFLFEAIAPFVWEDSTIHCYGEDG